MSTEQQLTVDLLHLKAKLIRMLSLGTFVIHPKDVLDEVNNILKHTQKENNQ